jgi:hypothetical protein
MVVIEMTNGKKHYCLENTWNYANKLLMDKNEFNYDFDFLEVYPCKLKRKWLFGRRVIDKLYPMELINHRHILHIYDIGKDDDMF